MNGHPKARQYKVWRNGRPVAEARTIDGAKAYVFGRQNVEALPGVWSVRLHGDEVWAPPC